MTSVYLGGTIKNQNPYPDRIIPPHLQIYAAAPGEAALDCATSTARLACIVKPGKVTGSATYGRVRDGRAVRPGDAPGTMTNAILLAIARNPAPLNQVQLATSFGANWHRAARKLVSARRLKYRAYRVPGKRLAIQQYTLPERPWPPLPTHARLVTDL